MTACSLNSSIVSHSWGITKTLISTFFLLTVPPLPLHSVSGALLPQNDVKKLDDEVWAILSNFSNGQAGFPPFLPPPKSSSFPSSRVPNSSSPQWSLHNLSPSSPASGVSSSVRPTRPQSYSPGHAPRLQVHSVGVGQSCDVRVLNFWVSRCYWWLFGFSFWGLGLLWVTRARTLSASLLVLLEAAVR